jgi:hypothetical protein
MEARTEMVKGLIFKYLPLTPTLSPFGGARESQAQLVVTTALILTFSPQEKGQRLHVSL